MAESLSVPDAYAVVPVLVKPPLVVLRLARVWDREVEGRRIAYLWLERKSP